MENALKLNKLHELNNQGIYFRHILHILPDYIAELIRCKTSKIEISFFLDTRKTVRYKYNLEIYLIL